MRTGHVLRAVGVAALVLSATRGAAAQNTATAEALFEKGRTELLAGHFDAACPALAESQRLDPRAGTLFSLAECEARWGKVASAVAHYADYTAQVAKLPEAKRAKQAERVKYAQEQLAALQPSVPLLTLRLPPDAPPGTTLSRDGTPVSAAALGVALPVDPGEYVVSVRTPDERTSEVRIPLAKGDRKDITAPSPPPRQAPAVVAPPVALPPPEAKKPASGVARPWVYAAGGVGVVGMAVGTVAGILAFQKKSVVSDGCPNKACTAAGLDAVNAGRTMGTVSDVGFAVGAVGLVAAGVLLLTAPAASGATTASWRPSLLVGQREAFLGAGRSW